MTVVTAITAMALVVCLSIACLFSKKLWATIDLILAPCANSMCAACAFTEPSSRGEGAKTSEFGFGLSQGNPRAGCAVWGQRCCTECTCRQGSRGDIFRA